MPATSTIAHTTRKGRESKRLTSPRAHDLITQAQYDFIVDLFAEKDLLKSPTFFDKIQAMDMDEYEAYVRHLLDQITGTSKRRASDLISSLLALPNVPQRKRTPEQHVNEAWWVDGTAQDSETVFRAMRKGADGPIVPRGSYALRTPGKNHVNDITFYSVWISEDGSRWSVKQYVSDELVRLQRTAQYMVLEKIAEDPSAAASLYGLEIGKCGICHRKLTNDISRERGIGPICAERWGW